MLIKSVTEVLTALGLVAPTLNLLTPDVNNYTALLMQPSGHIEGSASGVRNHDQETASAQFSRFLSQAYSLQVDLAVTPEYSMPWKVLVDTIRSGLVPAEGKIWAFGCESIQYSQLEQIRQQLGSCAVILYEQLVADDNRFIDPLAYIFSAPSAAGEAAKMVVLVQFKTHPMGDADHFEINGLQRGTLIYKFGLTGQSISLVSLICSDVFAFLDQDALAVYDRALILHIQLNPKPRHEQYRLYRDRLLRFQGDTTELICLNWAKDVCEWSGSAKKSWHNIAASAWYVKSSHFDDRDKVLDASHRKGFYYTWLRPLRAHAMFFNYDPSLFLIQASKVAHIGVSAAVSRRRGPQVTEVFAWNHEEKAWIIEPTAKDGFDDVISQSGAAGPDLERICKASPLAIERVVALSVGQISSHELWYTLQLLESCMIDTTEVIRRLTFCQDTDEAASAFRISRLKRCGHLFEILKDNSNLPPSLADLGAGFRFEWSVDHPNQNIVSVSGGRATAVYMGEESSDAEINRVSSVVAENLRRASKNGEEIRVKQRLAIWVREGNVVVLKDAHRYVKIDQMDDQSEFDIAREK